MRMINIILIRTDEKFSHAFLPLLRSTSFIIRSRSLSTISPMQSSRTLVVLFLTILLQAINPFIYGADALPAPFNPQPDPPKVNS